MSPAQGFYVFRYTTEDVDGYEQYWNPDTGEWAYSLNGIKPYNNTTSAAAERNAVASHNVSVPGRFVGYGILVINEQLALFEKEDDDHR